MTADRIYAVLLRFYPPSFRDEYGREMTQLFRDLYLVRGSVTLTCWISVVLDVARSAPALRVEAWCARRRENTRTLEGIMKLVAMLTMLMGVFGTLNALAEGMMGIRGTLDGTHLLAIMLGATAGALLLTAGIALLRRTPSARRTATFAAIGSLVIVVTARLAHPWMSIFSQLVGIGLPIALLAALQLSQWSGNDRSAA
ncbi:MAG: hypothetical protein ACJ8AD_15385 [Gemmatimonadaceae bacterium]